jgi:hypothetical protein
MSRVKLSGEQAAGAYRPCAGWRLSHGRQVMAGVPWSRECASGWCTSRCAICGTREKRFARAWAGQMASCVRWPTPSPFMLNMTDRQTAMLTLGTTSRQRVLSSMCRALVWPCLAGGELGLGDGCSGLVSILCGGRQALDEEGDCKCKWKMPQARLQSESRTRGEAVQT